MLASNGTHPADGQLHRATPVRAGIASRSGDQLPIAAHPTDGVRGPSRRPPKPSRGHLARDWCHCVARPRRRSQRVVSTPLTDARRAALPVSAEDASGSAVAYSARVALVLGVPGSAPCPPVAAMFCERAGGSRTGREPGRRSRRPEGVLDAAARGADHARRAGQEGAWGWCGCLAGGVRAFLSGRDQPRRPGTRGKGQPALPGSAGRRSGAPATR